MFRTAAPHRAPAYIHVRNGIVGVQEAIANAVVAGTPLHVVHLNSTSGDDIGRMLGLIAQAQDRGLDVTTEAYPYTAGATRIESALYDGWEERAGSAVGRGIRGGPERIPRCSDATCARRGRSRSGTPSAR